MNFERGNINKLETIGIGRIIHAIEIQRAGFMNRTKGKMGHWYEYLDSESIIQLLNFLCTTKSRIRDSYRIINEIELYTWEKELFYIRQIEGKTIKFNGKIYHIQQNLDLS